MGLCTCMFSRHKITRMPGERFGLPDTRQYRPDRWCGRLPPRLGIQSEEGCAEQRSGHEGCQVLCQLGVHLPGGQRTARHIVRGRQVLHHDEAQLRVEVEHLGHVLQAQPRLLPERVRLEAGSLLQAALGVSSPAFVIPAPSAQWLSWTSNVITCLHARQAAGAGAWIYWLLLRAGERGSS